MNKKFDIITIALMIILGIVLIVVVFNYFLKSEKLNVNKIDSPMTIINTESIYSGDKVIITSKPIESGSEAGKNIIISGDSGEGIIESQPEVKQGTSPIITSTGDISSKEKKEVLKELDQTLMELFDVVDLVTTVDETRLITEESEVAQ